MNKFQKERKKPILLVKFQLLVEALNLLIFFSFFSNPLPDAVRQEVAWQMSAIHLAKHRVRFQERFH
jgi:hypothetical protein